MDKCKQCFVLSDDSIKLCYDCLEAENKKLRAIKCPPISEGDSCICPIEELEERIEQFEKGGYIRHKSNCFMGEYNSLLTGQGCDCGLSQLMEDN